MTWTGEERRAHHNRSRVKDQIFEEIKKTQDPNLKAVLALMYGSLEYMDDAIVRVETKIDALRHDEATLKRVVLNGYNDKHHTHHEWLDTRISNDKFYKEFIAKAAPLLEWAEQHKEEQKQIRPVCDWAKETMEASLEAKKDKKTLFIKFLGGAVNHVGTALATALMAWIMWGPK